MSLPTTLSADLPGASALSNEPPIVQFTRAAGHVLAISFSYLSRASATLARLSFSPLSLVYSPIVYLLSPVIVLSQVLLQVFIFSPYNIVLSIARNVYPIYVFVGVACICAAFFGYTARMVSIALTYVIFPPRPPKTSSQDPFPEKETPTSSPPKTRLRKRVSIKEER